MHYKNFKTVLYCVTSWVNSVTEEQLRREADFFQKYVGVDKIYLEAFRDEFARTRMILTKNASVFLVLCVIATSLCGSLQKRFRNIQPPCLMNLLSMTFSLPSVCAKIVSEKRGSVPGRNSVLQK